MTDRLTARRRRRTLTRQRPETRRIGGRRNGRVSRWAVGLLWLALPACEEPAERPGTGDLDPIGVPVDTATTPVAFDVEDGSDADDQWTTGMARREYGPQGTADLSGARAARHDGFDRLVLEFATDTIPTYQVEYIEGPAIQCGSGDPVEVEGGGVLMVRLEGADAHDEAGNATVRDRRLRPALPVLLEARLICDFEGHVDWALGVTAPTAFRILELREPTRLAIDVKHAEPPP